MWHADDRRVFLEVKDPRALVDELVGQAGVFVPTRLPLALGTMFLLAVRLPSVSRSLELPMLVVGRRVPRGGSLLSAGVIAKLTDVDSPMFALLREVASGKVVDLEQRILDQQRVAAHAIFASYAEAITELVNLVEKGEATFPLDRLVNRNDRVALAVLVDDEDDPLLVPHVLIKSVHMLNGQRTCQAAPLDDNTRSAVQAFLTRGRARGHG